MPKFSILDLTVAQVEAIEVRSEISFDRWNSPKVSKAALFGSILVELGGVDPATVAGMKLGDLAGRIADLLDLTGGQGDAEPEAA